MKTTIAFLLVGTAMALTACKRADEARSASVAAPGHDVSTSTLPGAPPPLTPEPTISPERVFADAETTKLPPGKGGPMMEQEHFIRAQQAAARAPDTASADAAKKRVMDEAAQARG
jgi:hypothetical protein